MGDLGKGGDEGKEGEGWKDGVVWCGASVKHSSTHFQWRYTHIPIFQTRARASSKARARFVCVAPQIFNSHTLHHAPYVQQQPPLARVHFR